MKKLSLLLAKSIINYLEWYLFVLNFIVVGVLYFLNLIQIDTLKVSTILFVIIYPFVVKFCLRTEKEMKSRKELIDEINQKLK